MSERTALVVEDDGAVRELLAEALELRGYDVKAVGRSEEALALLESGWEPSVIVLDRGMPGMSGDELLARLKRNAAWARVPVAVVSGRAQGEGRALAAEPDAYFEKPFDVDALDEALRALSG